MTKLPPALPWSGLALRMGLAAAVITLGAVAAFGTLRPDLWMVEHVLVEGVDRADPAVIRHLADIPNGRPLWGVDPEAVERGVQTHPWVRAATVHVEWPDRIRIVVEEHRIAALVLRREGMFAVADTGQVFLKPSRGDLDHPLLTGFETEGSPSEAGPPPSSLFQLAVPDALALLDALDRRDLVPRTEVSEVAFSATAGFTVHTRGARVAFGHGDLDRQLDRLAALVQHGLDLSSAMYVDLAPRTVATLRPLSPPSPPHSPRSSP